MNDILPLARATTSMTCTCLSQTQLEEVDDEEYTLCGLPLILSVVLKLVKEKVTHKQEA